MRITGLQSGPSWARDTGYGLGGGKRWPRMKALGQPLKGLEVEKDRVLNHVHGATETPAGTRGPRSRQDGHARASLAEAGDWGTGRAEGAVLSRRYSRLLWEGSRRATWEGDPESGRPGRPL